MASVPSGSSGIARDGAAVARLAVLALLYDVGDLLAVDVEVVVDDGRAATATGHREPTAAAHAAERTEAARRRGCEPLRPARAIGVARIARVEGGERPLLRRRSALRVVLDRLGHFLRRPDDLGDGVAETLSDLLAEVAAPVLTLDAELLPELAQLLAQLLL